MDSVCGWPNILGYMPVSLLLFMEKLEGHTVAHVCIINHGTKNVTGQEDKLKVV